MICLRCGYCCIYPLIMIIKDPELGIRDDNIVAHLGDGPCIHLGGDKPGEYFCQVHDRKWYKQTPCFSHGQIERGNTNCRMGAYLLAKERGDTNGKLEVSNKYQDNS